MAGIMHGSLFNRNPADLTNIGQSLKYFVDTVLLQGCHPLINRLYGKIVGGGIFFDELLYFRGPLH